ncbi:26036_t:CDS:2 [Gigaspora margarita]|uniref:Vacuolar calcium ion transporter n=1 Tax=Gigaspora margarita TaxID=4874 RepID=A0ABM8VVR2_GIGMA|nr:26036_t:CDS:2 [Gigaspora margarita]
MTEISIGMPPYYNVEFDEGLAINICFRPEFAECYIELAKNVLYSCPSVIPLAQLLGFVTEELSCGVGQILAALLNVTFGNAVELIISIVALSKGQICVVQASVLGSVFLNILLVLGSCFLAGGITILKNERLEQEFSSTAAQASSSVMTLVCIALIVPAAFSLAINENYNISNSNDTLNTIDPRLKTHKDLFKKEGIEESQISNHISIFLLIIVTVVTGFSAEFLVSSIEGVVMSLGLSKTFIGLILLPIIGNAAEHATSVTIAIKDKMDFAICVSVGSTTLYVYSLQLYSQITWYRVSILELSSSVLMRIYITVDIMNSDFSDGRSNWLEGALLIATYLIIALAFFFYPDT